MISRAGARRAAETIVLVVAVVALLATSESPEPEAFDQISRTVSDDDVLAMTLTVQSSAPPDTVVDLFIWAVDRAGSPVPAGFSLAGDVLERSGAATPFGEGNEAPAGAGVLTVEVGQLDTLPITADRRWAGRMVVGIEFLDDGEDEYVILELR